MCSAEQGNPVPPPFPDGAAVQTSACPVHVHYLSLLRLIRPVGARSPAAKVRPVLSCTTSVTNLNTFCIANAPSTFTHTPAGEEG